MKTILIVAIVFICGSLKPKVEPCSNKLEVRFYVKGRLVGSTVFDDGNYWVGKCNFPRTNISPACDSVSMAIYIPPVKSKHK